MTPDDMAKLERANLELVTFDQLGYSDAEGAAVRLTDELMADGLMTTTTWNWDDHVVAIRTRGTKTVKGMIAWRWQQWTRAVFVSIGGVHKDWRRDGLYRLLWARLVEVVREKHPTALSIDSGYHVANEASAAMHKALGRPVVSMITRYMLEPDA